MQDKQFYSQLVVKLLDEPFSNNGRLKVQLDNGKIIGLNLLNKDGNNISTDLLKKFFYDKAKLFANSEFLLNRLRKDSSLRKSLRKKARVAAKNKNIVDEDDLDDFISDFVDTHITEIADEQAFDNATIKKNSIIRLSGIVRSHKDKFILDSKAILFNDDGTVFRSGTYLVAVNEKKVPLFISQKTSVKNTKYFEAILSKQTTLLQFNTFVSHCSDTIQDRLDNNTKNDFIPKIIVNPKSDLNTLKKYSLILNDYKSTSFNKRVDAFNNIVALIVNDFDNIFPFLKIVTPLYLNSLDLNHLKEKLATSLLNTTFRKDFKYINTESLISIFDELIINDQFSILSTYSPPPSNKGFFENQMKGEPIISSKTLDLIFLEAMKLVPSNSK
jgi:hypothetical protein